MCPNQFECYGRGEAAFILLGANCTRRCTLCNIGKAEVSPHDPDEPARVAKAVAEMEFSFCVLTMTSRDVPPDGGADHIARTINLIKANNSEVGVESFTLVIARQKVTAKGVSQFG
jgi:lipoyl synthase